MRTTHLYEPSEGSVLPIKAVFQMLRTTCPMCHKDVQFAVHQDDKLYKEENEFLTKTHAWQTEEIMRLHKIIDSLIENK